MRYRGLFFLLFLNCRRIYDTDSSDREAASLAAPIFKLNFILKVCGSQFEGKRSGGSFFNASASSKYKTKQKPLD